MDYSLKGRSSDFRPEIAYKVVGLCFPQHMRVSKKNIQKGERNLMISQNLRENYTKVPYAVNQTKVVSPVCSAVPKQGGAAGVKIIEGVLLTSLLTGAVFFNLDDLAHASDITRKAERFYFGTFMTIAKWVIIIKGGWDIVTKTLKEDFEGAKRSVVQYLMVFAVLMGLPYALEMVEDLFAGEA